MKGFIDILYIPIIVFGLIIAFAIIFEVSASLKEAIKGTAIDSNNIVSSGIESVLNLGSYLLLAVYFGLPISGIILAYFFGSEPIFAILGVVLLLVSVFINAILKDVAISIVSQLTNAQAIIANNVILSNAIAYFPFIMFIFGLILMLVQHMRKPY